MKESLALPFRSLAGTAFWLAGWLAGGRFRFITESSFHVYVGWWRGRLSVVVVVAVFRKCCSYRFNVMENRYYYFYYLLTTL